MKRMSLEYVYYTYYIFVIISMVCWVWKCEFSDIWLLLITFQFCTLDMVYGE